MRNFLRLTAVGLVLLAVAALGLKSVLATETSTLLSTQNADNVKITGGSVTGLGTLGAAACTITGASPQTCNGSEGVVTTGTLTTAAATDASYTINNSSVSATSVVQCTDEGYSGTLVTNGYPVLMVCIPGSGTITVHITNLHATNALSGTVQIGFNVFN